MSRKPKCTEAAWHPVKLREPYGVDAGGWWCTECWGYIAGQPPRCQEPTCPDFGDPDFGEATCPQEHADPQATRR